MIGNGCPTNCAGGKGAYAKWWTSLSRTNTVRCAGPQRVAPAVTLTWIEPSVVTLSGSITGNATDSNGATYGFNYHNHVTLEIPPAGFPFQITIGTDHFNLVGNGQANQLQVHFVARATFYPPPTPPTIEFINVHGSPRTCDPI